jgi:hypothetical protein
MLQYAVDLPADPKYLLFSPIRVNNEIYQWLLDNIGRGTESDKVPPISQNRIMWQAVEVSCNPEKLRTNIRIFFRNSDDAVFFKIVWL